MASTQGFLTKHSPVWIISQTLLKGSLMFSYFLWMDTAAESPLIPTIGWMILKMVKRTFLEGWNQQTFFGEAPDRPVDTVLVLWKAILGSPQMPQLPLFWRFKQPLNSERKKPRLERSAVYHQRIWVPAQGKASICWSSCLSLVGLVAHQCCLKSINLWTSLSLVGLVPSQPLQASWSPDGFQSIKHH